MKTAMVGLLVTPAAMAQQTPAQQTPGTTPDPAAAQTQPASPTAPAAPAATMTPVTVTGSLLLATAHVWNWRRRPHCAVD